MKNIFKNKKILVFGIVGFFALALISALVVNYLSNTATVELIIESPMMVGFADGSGNPDYTITTKDFGTVIGGETFSYKSWCKNQANVDIKSFPVITIISNDGVDWGGQEITSVIFRDAGTWTGDILPMLYVVKDNGILSSFTTGDWKTVGVADKTKLKIVFDNGDLLPNGYDYFSGAESWNEMDITTSTGMAPGDYSLKLCQLNDLLGDCQ